MTRTVERDTVIKAGSAFALTLEANGDLSGATAVVWNARRSPSIAVGLSKAATVTATAPHRSTMVVALTAADTAATGYWLYDVTATVDGQPYRFPSEGYLRLRVIP